MQVLEIDIDILLRLMTSHKQHILSFPEYNQENLMLVTIA